MMDILKKYNLKICNNKYIHSVDLEKRILINFLAYWDNPQDIREDLLPELNQVVNGELKFIDIGADVVGLAYIESKNTKLLGSDLGHLDFEMPTSDFKDLILVWLSILESNGK